jgi:hypothetical protein
VKIGVFPAGEMESRARLWHALAALYSLDFVACRDATETAECDAAFLFCAGREAAEQVAPASVRFMAFVGSPEGAATPAAANVAVSDDADIRPCFRGCALPDASIDSIAQLPPRAGDRVLARKGTDALWICAERAGAPAHFIATDAPTLAATEYLYEHFQAERWARLFPMLHFLQDVSGWSQPPLRAAIMFDDPNLHWKSYGYISYPELAEHARTHRYHAVFATVPLDSWYVHGETAALFRANKERLSLCVHGNNHTYYELAGTATDERRVALAAQALRRIGRLEAASGLKVSRVMAAPHGACSHAMATAMAKTGFEAACISRSSVMGRNAGTAWPLTVGMTPAEFLGDGLPVYPRYNIRWDDTYPIFAAFLGQPIVPVGHHEDSADGLALLRRSAELINSFGEVRWMDLESIARTNFITRRSGGILHIRMYARSISLVVPDGVEHIAVERPWLQNSLPEELVLQNGAEARSATEEIIPVHAGETVAIRSIRADAVASGSIESLRTPLWALARRQLCEGRDRLRPALDKLRGSGNGAATNHR